MLIYNVTVKVETELCNEWLDWMLDFHIPEVLGTGCFVKHQLLKLIDIDETDGKTYAIQYYSESLDKYKFYIDHYALGLRKQVTDKWGNRIISFRTLMEVVK